MSAAERDIPWLTWPASGGLALMGLWSFFHSASFPIDAWDAYDSLINARWLAGHDLTRLAEAYRVTRPPGISLVMAPLIAVGYQPGQRGLMQFMHLVPWAITVAGLALTYARIRAAVGPSLAAFGVLVFAINPLIVHFHPITYADIASMTFSLVTLVLVVRLHETSTWRTAALVTLATAMAMLTKYPVGVLGVLIPLAHLCWVWAGTGRPHTLTEKIRASMSPKLALALLLALGLFIAVHVVIFTTLVPGEGPIFTRLATVFSDTRNGGVALEGSDPRWELPRAIVVLFGVPMAFACLLGMVAVLRERTYEGFQHLFWAVGFTLLFVVVIGHKETRYIFPALPSYVWLCMKGLSRFLLRPRILAGLCALVFAAAVPPSFAEFQRMQDPLYTKGPLLEWARYVLDNAKGRPILQQHAIYPFALYIKDPVVFETDEIWHYHHMNHGGLEWFFDRKLMALDAQPGAQATMRIEDPWIRATIPPDWSATLGPDATLLVALPEGGVFVATPQGWTDARTVKQQAEPPLPFTATVVEHHWFTKAAQSEDRVRYTAKAFEMVLAKGPDGWRVSVGPTGARWFLRPDATSTPVPLSSPLPEPPETIEGLWSTTQTFPIR